MNQNARATALRVLVSCRSNGAWADAALKAQLSRDGLSGPDAALCSRIVYGVMQNQILLDFYISAYCSQKPDFIHLNHKGGQELATRFVTTLTKYLDKPKVHKTPVSQTHKTTKR